MKGNKLVILSIIVFSLSYILIRIQDTFIPIMTNLEANHSTVLRHMEIWDQNGGLKNFFVPSLTYPDGANYFINNHSTFEKGLSGFVDDQGEYFYMTYPPFGYIAPYLFFKFFGLPTNIISLRVFNIFIHILTALFFLTLVQSIFKKNSISLLAFVLYLFLPISALSHTDVYMSDILAQLFFISSIYLFYKIFYLNGKYNKNLLLYLLSIFFSTYTDWLGFIVVGIITFFAIKIKDKTKKIKILIGNILIPLLSITLTFIQYTRFISFNNFINIFINKYSNSYSERSLFLDKISNFLSHYTSTLPIIVIFFLLILMIISANKKIEFLENKNEIIFISYLLFLPCVIHNLIFFNWASVDVHDFSAVKVMFFIIFILSLLMYIFWFKINFDNQKVMITVSVFFLLFLFVFSIFYYFKHKHIQPNIQNFGFCMVGNEIAKLSSKNDLIFIKDNFRQVHSFPVEPVMVFCAKRNIEIYTNYKDAVELMKKNNTNQGIIFSVGYFSNVPAKIFNIEKIPID